MKDGVFTLKDLARKLDMREDTLARWTKTKLIRPAGFEKDRSPLFTPDILDRVAHIRVLESLGYGLEEIRKIVRKVGLPSDKSSRAHSSKASLAAAKSAYLTVGDLAERSGVSPRTLKHWEDKGIIVPDMRTEGGFRLYPQAYVFLCQLIRDLQLFGYSLEEIKAVSDDVRALMAIEDDIEAHPPARVAEKLEAMLAAIQGLYNRMKLIEEGVDRWRDLLKKKRKDILTLKAKNAKRRNHKAAAGKPGKGRAVPSKPSPPAPERTALAPAAAGPEPGESSKALRFGRPAKDVPAASGEEDDRA